MPDTLQLVIASDLHLDRYNWVRHPTLCGDSQESFRQLIDYCVRRPCLCPLLLLGDTFEVNRPDSAAVRAFNEGMERMEQAGNPVYFIQGDHDLTDPAWPGVHPHARHIHQQTIELFCGAKLYGHDYQPGGMDSALAAIPEGTACFATHCGWTDCGDRGATDASLSQVPYAQLIFSGHWHRHFVYEGVGALGQRLRLYSPGSSNMRALDEDVLKQFFELRYDDAGGLYCEHVDYLTRPCIRFDAHDPGTLDHVVTFLGQPLAGPPVPEVVRKPIAAVRYNDRLPEAAVRLTRAAGDRWHLFLDPRHTGEEVVIADTPVVEEGQCVAPLSSLTEGLPQFAPVGTPAYNGLRRLLESQAPAAELDRMYTEWTEAQDDAQTQGQGQAVGDRTGTLRA